MQRHFCFTQTGMSHILLTVEIFYIRPGMSGELLGNGSIQAAYIMTRLFYMQHRCIIVNLLAKAEGLNFTVETDSTAAQLQLLKAQKGLLDSIFFALQRRILRHMLVAPALAEVQTFHHIIHSNRLINEIRMCLDEGIIVILLPVQLTAGKRCQLFLQIYIIPIIAVFFIRQTGHYAFKALLGKIIDTVHLKRLALMLLFKLLHQTRQILITSAKRLNIKVNVIAFNLQQQEIMRYAPINMIAVTPDKKIGKGTFTAILM